jgi:hypothetical protein
LCRASYEQVDRGAAYPDARNAGPAGQLTASPAIASGRPAPYA